eukprot:2645198-Amphidinium_carterae.5
MVESVTQGTRYVIATEEAGNLGDLTKNPRKKFKLLKPTEGDAVYSGVDPPKEHLELEDACNNLQSSDSVPKERSRDWNDHIKSSHFPTRSDCPTCQESEGVRLDHKKGRLDSMRAGTIFLDVGFMEEQGDPSRVGWDCPHQIGFLFRDV